MQRFMKTLRKTFRAGEKGFTLVELLVVIAILGTLAGVVALNVSGFVGRGGVQACQTETDIVQAAVVAYMADNDGAVPTIAEMITAELLMDDPKYIADADISTSGLVTKDCSGE